MASKIDGIEEKTLCYRLVKRVNPLDREAEAGVGPVIVNRAVVNLEEICELLSERSLLCDSDIYQVVQALLTNATMRLLNSEAFNLGYMGYLALSIKTDLVKDPEEYRSSNVRKAVVRFYPSPRVRSELKGLLFKRVK